MTFRAGKLTGLNCSHAGSTIPAIGAWADYAAAFQKRRQELAATQASGTPIALSHGPPTFGSNFPGPPFPRPTSIPHTSQPHASPSHHPFTPGMAVASDGVPTIAAANAGPSATMGQPDAFGQDDTSVQHGLNRQLGPGAKSGIGRGADMSGSRLGAKPKTKGPSERAVAAARAAAVSFPSLSGTGPSDQAASPTAAADGPRTESAEPQAAAAAASVEVSKAAAHLPGPYGAPKQPGSAQHNAVRPASHASQVNGSLTSAAQTPDGASPSSRQRGHASSNGTAGRLSSGRGVGGPGPAKPKSGVRGASIGRLLNQMRASGEL